MRPGLRRFVVAGVAAVTVVLSPAILRSETIQLELKRLADRSTAASRDFLFRSVNPQYFYMTLRTSRPARIARRKRPTSGGWFTRNPRSTT